MSGMYLTYPSLEYLGFGAEVIFVIHCSVRYTSISICSSSHRMDPVFLFTQSHRLKGRLTARKAITPHFLKFETQSSPLLHQRVFTDYVKNKKDPLMEATWHRSYQDKQCALCFTEKYELYWICEIWNDYQYFVDHIGIIVWISFLPGHMVMHRS